MSVHSSGELRILIHVTREYEIDLLAVQEVKWLGRRMTENKDLKICYSCDDQMFSEQALFLVNASDQQLLILIALIGECVLL
jgi:hypothetical protein